MYVQGACAVFLAALAGPGLLAPDLANNALPLYFSRPLTRWSYALARLTVLVGMLSVVTWVPGLLLFGLQVGLAGGWWFLSNWTLGAGMVVGFLLWLLVLVLLLLFGGGGYRLGGPENGPLYGGSGIGLVLVILLILYLFGGLRR